MPNRIAEVAGLVERLALALPLHARARPLIGEIRDALLLIEYDMMVEVERHRLDNPVAAEPRTLPTCCGEDGCAAGLPLYQIARAGEPPIWRCLRHVPRIMTFPIGLHGEDRERWRMGEPPEVIVLDDEPLPSSPENEGDLIPSDMGV